MRNWRGIFGNDVDTCAILLIAACVDRYGNADAEITLGVLINEQVHTFHMFGRDNWLLLNGSVDIHNFFKSKCLP